MKASHRSSGDPEKVLYLNQYIVPVETRVFQYLLVPIRIEESQRLEI